ncbi:divalent-cation tolerance protein CutA [Leptolyngbya sp. PCC 6406]|uniref:divalent-cation tolerance protein CutA n=1 Tax=Leptolyngbya sp. PCC 6406 TaxID=1173264 RepID=UPI0002ABE4D3|nr:divalent-cation tolerance protein CutA [Leptolyngbya sp. PCC 6406]
MMNSGAESDYGIVLVTIDSQAQARAIATAVINARLAACVNMFPIHSVYTWQGMVQEEEEWQLVIKTNLAYYPALEAKIHSLHPYDLPEIIALPIVQGASAYLAWIGRQVDGLSPQAIPSASAPLDLSD